jgi:hypothetical protein
MFVRVTRGRFAAEQYDEMAKRLQEAEAVLSPAIRALPGLIDYYAGIDRESASMIRISVWDTAEHAAQIASLPEIVSLKVVFEAAGVDWEPSSTYPVSWWVQSS